MTTTRLTKGGQPVMNTTILLEAEDADGNLKGWLPVKVVGKLYGRGGTGDLVGIVVEWEDGGREIVPWRGLNWGKA